MTTTLPHTSTCPRCTDCGRVHGLVRRRLGAIGTLLGRLTLLVVAGLAFLVYRTQITQFLGLLVAAALFIAADLAAFRSFTRTWKGEDR